MEHAGKSNCSIPKKRKTPPHDFTGSLFKKMLVPKMRLLILRSIVVFEQVIHALVEPQQCLCAEGVGNTANGLPEDESKAKREKIG
jgi:hypothetical protein